MTVFYSNAIFLYVKTNLQVLKHAEC